MASEVRTARLSLQLLLPLARPPAPRRSLILLLFAAPSLRPLVPAAAPVVAAVAAASARVLVPSSAGALTVPISVAIPLSVIVSAAPRRVPVSVTPLCPAPVPLPRRHLFLFRLLSPAGSIFVVAIVAAPIPLAVQSRTAAGPRVRRVVAADALTLPLCASGSPSSSGGRRESAGTCSRSAVVCGDHLSSKYFAAPAHRVLRRGCDLLSGPPTRESSLKSRILIHGCRCLSPRCNSWLTVRSSCRSRGSKGGRRQARAATAEP